MDRLSIQLDGDNRYVDAETLLKHISAALRGRDLVGGVVHQIEVDREGGVWLNGMKAYQPKRPQIAAKGA